MRELVADRSLVAKCGLYCGACPRYLKGKCPGCSQNVKASWCKVRTCTMEHNFETCADCTLKPLEDCREFNSFISKVFGFVFRSDRSACIRRIGTVGVDVFADEMTKAGIHSLRR